VVVFRPFEENISSGVQATLFEPDASDRDESVSESPAAPESGPV
jgi:hypothetical protein